MHCMLIQILQTKSTDDVKDFATQIKNKFRRSFGVRNVASQMIPLPTDQVPPIQTQSVNQSIK